MTYSRHYRGCGLRSLGALAALLLLCAPSQAQNPLARPPAWVGTWKGEHVSVELKQEGGAAAGELKVGEEKYPLQAKPAANDPALLEGTFTANGHPFKFTFALDAQNPDAAKLVSDGTTHALTRVKPTANPLAGKGPANPLGGGPKGPPNPLGGGPKPSEGSGGGATSGDALAGAFQGNAQKRSASGGAWSFELPEGWTVVNEAGAYTVITPGGTIESAQTEGLVLGEIGPLTPEQKAKPARDAIREAKPNLLQMLEGEGIQVANPGEPKEVEVAGVPGGVFEWQGKNAQGQAWAVWIGVLVQKERYLLVIGLLPEGKAAAHAPKLKRVFASCRLDPNAPLPQPPEGGAMPGDEGGDDEGN